MTDEIPSVDPTTGDSTSGPTPCAYTDYREGTVEASVPATGEDSEGLERAVWDRLYSVEDPEMPVSIVDLGLIYGLEIEDSIAHVEMTLTYTGCPAREMLTDDIRDAVESVEGIERADIRLVWSPEWTVEMVTDSGREQLKEFGLSL